MRVVLAAVIIAVLTGTAFAQQAPMPKYGEDLDKSKSPTEIQAEKDATRAYQKSLGNIPDKGPGDPWGAVRNDGPKTASDKTASDKAASATAKPKKTKTGSAEAKQ